MRLRVPRVNPPRPDKLATPRPKPKSAAKSVAHQAGWSQVSDMAYSLSSSRGRQGWDKVRNFPYCMRAI